MMVKENILLFCCSSNRMQAIRAPDYIRLATMETNGRFLGETTRSPRAEEVNLEAHFSNYCHYNDEES